MGVQAYSSLEPRSDYNQDLAPLTNEGSIGPFQPFWELQKYIWCSFRLVIGKQVKRYLSCQGQSSLKGF